MSLPTLLICDDDAIFQIGAKKALSRYFNCLSATDCDEALDLIKHQSIQILLLDVHLRNKSEGLHYIPKLLELDPDLSIVMNSHDNDFSTVREAMRLGAVDYLPKKFEPNEMIHSLNRVHERQRLLRAQQKLDFEARSQNRHFSLVGSGKWHSDMMRTLEKVRNSQANVVITGETGTGKEVIARHLRRTLKSGVLEPFVTVDSATILSSTAESALFGHEKGAFTGADRLSKGLFEEADEGTIYFDEISNMPLGIQAKLLRVLQEKEISRLGSTKVIRLDFRVICASNRDLRQMVSKGEFKADLFQRLNVIPISLPPLRERTQDLSILLSHFVSRFPAPSGPLVFEDETMKILSRYPWPGNIRELENLVFFLATMSDGGTVTPTALPSHFLEESPRQAEHHKEEESDDFYLCVQRYETTLLKEKFRKFEGKISVMAKRLGMDRSHLYSKLKSFGIYQLPEQGLEKARNQRASKKRSPVRK